MTGSVISLCASLVAGAQAPVFPQEVGDRVRGLADTPFIVDWSDDHVDHFHDRTRHLAIQTGIVVPVGR